MPSSLTSPVTVRVPRPVGSHVFVGKGLVAGALRAAEEIGAEAVQVFVGNPRGWRLTDGDPDVDAAFRESCASRGLRAFVHTPYLVNLGSPTLATYERSVATVPTAPGTSMGNGLPSSEVNARSPAGAASSP